MHQPDSILPFVTRLTALGVPYFVTGSVAGTLYGEPRLTHDIDLAVVLTGCDLREFVGIEVVK